MKPLSFDELYQRHRHDVFVWSMRYAAGDAAWAEDLTHDVFILAWKNRDRIRPAEVGQWLHRVTCNLAIDRLRRRSSWLAKLQGWVGLGQTESLTPEHHAAARQELRGATQALAQLPAQERVALCMKAIDGLSQREIADALSLSEGYVSKLLTRATGRLRAAGWEVADG